MKYSARNVICPVALAFAILISSVLADVGFANPNPHSLLDLATNAVVTRVLYADPSRLLSGAGDVSANGAVSGNATSDSLVNVESQRWGADLVQAAIVTHTDPTLGIKVIQYGLNHEAADGSFGAENDFQHTSFFLEAAARTMLILQSQGDRYLSFVDQSKPKIELAAKQFIASGDLQRQESKGLTFTHRYYLVAAALGEVAALTGDESLKSEAKRLCLLALDKQLEDGTYPEKGGFDLNYNAASGLFAARYYVVCEDHALRLRLKNMLRKALKRELAAVQPDGSLSIEDSTRTGRDAMHDGSNKKKGRDVKGIIQMFAFGGDVTQQPEYEDVAQRIATARGW